MTEAPKAGETDEKTAARASEAAEDMSPGSAVGLASDVPQDACEQSPSDAAKRLLNDSDMPPLDSLGEDADYSAFLSAGVSAALRKQGLRQLFSSARYNVIDGLDDYCEDFTQHIPLGNVVPAELKRRLQAALNDESNQARPDHHPAAGAPHEQEHAEPPDNPACVGEEHASAQEQTQHDNPDLNG